MADLDAMVAETKALISPIISKPKMSEKLLSKPPFRFLHDTVSGITKATGFADGLFSGDELNSKALKEKPQKVGYLDKLIAFVKEQSGMDLAVKSSKIVAGAEPVNTNELLQVFAKLATGALSGGGGGGGGDNGAAEAKEEAAKEAEAAEAARRAEEERAAEEERRRAADAAAAAAAEEQAAAEERQRQRDEEARRRADDEAAAKMEAANNAPAGGAGGAGGPPVSHESLGCVGTPDRTREIVGPLITKPKLSDKLLSKPPMRFLHDIVMNVGKATGWGAGLFEDSELDAANVKAKPAKLAFLDKVVRCVSLQLNCICPARPGKIVAGAEADNTNIMIQMIGLCAQQGPNDDAVRRTLAGEKPGESAAAAPAPAPAPTSDDSSKIAAEREAQRKADADAAARRHEAEQAKIAAAQQRAKEKAEQAAIEAAAAEEARQREAAAAAATSTPMTAAIPAASAQPTRSARPQTAGRRPPRVKDPTQISNAQPVPTARAVGVMREGADADSESDDETPEAGGGDFGAAFDAGGAGAGAGAGARISASAAVGKHTRDILNEEKKSESKEPSAAAPAPAPSGGGIKMGRIKKARGDMGSFSQVELDNLRDAIQKLCRSTDPLGRSMEYVHEDMDVMKRELQEWRNEHTKHNDTMTAELQATEDSLKPLKRELAEMEDKLVEQQTKIHAAKASIAKNDVRIQDLLKMVVTQ